MDVLADFRHTRPYRVWRALREEQQVARYLSVLAERLPPKMETWSASLTCAALEQRAPSRRQLNERPLIAAFGARDWEGAGLWQAFGEVGKLELFEYAPRARAERKPSAALRRELGTAFLAHVERSGPVDVAFFYASGTYVDPGILAELARRRIWTIALGLDDKQQQPGRLAGDLKDWQLELARGVDLYWTTWRAGMDWLWMRGARPWYAPEAASPELFAPREAHRDIDILWLGRAYGPRRDLIAFLRKFGFSVDTYGPGWKGGAVSHDQMLDLYARAKVVLGMGGVGHSDRIKHLKGRDFEAPMAGAAYLTSFNPELADHYVIGSEILCYASKEECAEVLRWVLPRPAILERLRVAARERCVRDHTWERRLAGVLAPLWVGDR